MDDLEREHDPEKRAEARHPIQVVARRTGVSIDLLRAWERRYSAVVPQRQSGNRRLYSDLDVARVTLLGEATCLGLRIGDAARMNDVELVEFIAEHRAAVTGRGAVPAAAAVVESGPPSRHEQHLDGCRRAVLELDADGFERGLARAQVDLALTDFIRCVIGPLVTWIGAEWSTGGLRVAHEHLATSMLRAALSSNLRALGGNHTVGVIVVATPAGQVHELGAYLAAVCAAAAGWRVHYLGPDLPADEILYAVASTGARHLALSLVYPEEDAGVVGQLLALGAGIAPGTSIVVGGGAAPSYDATLAEIGAERVSDCAELARVLMPAAA